MSVIAHSPSPVPFTISHASHFHPHKERRLEREKRETQKALQKHLQHLQKPEVKAALLHSKEKAEKAEPILSNTFPLDLYISNREPLPHIKVNPFANVHGSVAKANLEKLGLELTAAKSSHFAVRTKPALGHLHGHRLGTLPVHQHEIPEGTHHAYWDEMNANLIAFLNQADENAACLPVEPRDSFRQFVAAKLSEAGAKSSTEILPKDILSTTNHKTIKSIQALIENANPDTVFNIWNNR